MTTWTGRDILSGGHHEVDKSSAGNEGADINQIIDTASPVPPYEQLRRRIAAQIDAGKLEPGTRLPTVRDLAHQTGLANNTAAKAYRELEAAGYIRTEGRRGTFVAARTEHRGDGNGGAAGEDALAHCMRIEMSLLRPDAFTDEEPLSGWLDHDFTLVHHDGRLLTRQEAVAVLRAEADEPPAVEGLEAEYLGPSVVLLGYVTRRGPSAWRHSTTWVRGVTGWRCRHRQSTPISD